MWSTTARTKCGQQQQELNVVNNSKNLMWSTTARTKYGEVCSMLQETASLDNVSEE